MSTENESEKDMFEEYDFDYEVENPKDPKTKIEKTVTFKKWPLSRTGKNVKLAMGLFVAAMKEFPDLNKDNWMKALPFVCHDGIDDVLALVENSLPKDVDKAEFMENVKFERLSELLGVILSQNFLSPIFLQGLAKATENFPASGKKD